MHPLHAAIYARVSSDQQAAAHPIASQVAALRERGALAGLALPETLQLLDAGSSGATLVRPALDRRRDVMAAGAIDRRYVHSPDRRAHQYASQVLWVDAWPRMGVEVVCWHRAVGRSPAEELLRQVQGRMTASERAKIGARPRLGTGHAARAGVVQVWSGAPDGYR